MSKPQILTTAGGTPSGCTDAQGNVIAANENSPAGKWCRSFIAGNGNMQANPGNNSGPAIFIAKSYRNFVGSDKASNKSNITYIATCGIGVVSGYFIANAGKKKRVVLGMGIGLGLGIGAGLLANSLMK